MSEFTREGDVVVLRFDSGENRFTPALLDQVDDTLSAIEAIVFGASEAATPIALVTTGTGKFFSNGLDLDWIMANQDLAGENLSRVHAMFARVLRLPCITVAALNGHAFAGGGMLALAHDFRVMRADRGYFCLPEVDLGMPFTDGMRELITGRLSKQTAHEAMVTGRRYSGQDAQAAGIVDLALAEDRVLPEAIDFAASLAAKASKVVATIRTDMYRPALAALDAEVAKGAPTGD
ncbi:enoyl-CoA hydratase/isomerase family protein [soil metagenome]